MGKVGNEKVGDESVTTHPVISKKAHDESVKKAQQGEEDKVRNMLNLVNIYQEKIIDSGKYLPVMIPCRRDFQANPQGILPNSDFFSQGSWYQNACPDIFCTDEL